MYSECTHYQKYLEKDMLIFFFWIWGPKLGPVPASLKGSIGVIKTKKEKRGVFL
jgi:hypothetical protein